MKTLIVLLAVLAVTFSQVERRCKESPVRWFGYFREVNYDASPDDVSFRYANISYDRELMKIEINEFERREGDERFDRRTYLSLFQEKIMYVVEFGRCRKENMNETRFPDFGIPEDATFFGFDYLGASIPNYGVGVDQFHHRSEETPESGDYHGSYAPIGSEASECVPILSSFVNQAPPGPPSRSTKNIHTTYFNLTTTLPAGAFKIPPLCEQ